MNKRFLIFIVITLVAFTGCDKGAKNTYNETEATGLRIKDTTIPMPTAKYIPTTRPTPATKQTTTTAPTPITNQGVTQKPTIKSVRDDKLNSISISQSGLERVTLLDFMNLKLNERISDILNDLNIYNDGDYRNGLVQGYNTDSLLISERFTENIISDIKIGTDTAVLKSVLGEPSFCSDYFSFYKTSQYYIGFKGKEKIEQAIIRNNPSKQLKYSPKILEVILKELNEKDYSDLSSSIESNKELTSFFESASHIEGGGWYASSFDGITIEEFPDENYITVYNNFEGDLYDYSSLKSNYKVVFKNEDYNMDLLSQEISNYIDINEEFNSDGSISPSGKLKSIYDWFSAECQYFTIRTLDNSKQDFRIPVMSKEYKWINDNYIVFIDAIYNIPYIIRVNNSTDFNLINVFYEVGIIKEKDPSFADSNLDINDLTIQDVTDNTITFEDKETNKIFEIKYHFKINGSIKLSINN